MAPRRSPGDQPCPHGIQPGPSAQAMPLRWPDEAQGTGHTYTAGRRGSGDWPRHHSGHTGSRVLARSHAQLAPMGTATLSRQPDETQGKGHATTAATRGRWDRPHTHGRETGPRRPATPTQAHPWPRAPPMPRRRPPEAKSTGFLTWRPPEALGTGYAPTAANQGPWNRPRPHGSHPCPRGQAKWGPGNRHFHTMARRNPGKR